ncbi:hypothetical protein Dsin_028432 [Dipteronia sinensis]|uniref:Reverse transcriptase domain-containing protein n=1 Tax=Dipteronia sinensis TaxID=43782 RepID=A0AAD9ZS74_9ROSI|nr:hypothetical protein Dsin_028432 [Dipteronia sinensis]
MADRLGGIATRIISNNQATFRNISDCVAMVSEGVHMLDRKAFGARLSVLINGSPKGYFSCSRGVRRGDPLSPVLFCLAEKAFNSGLSHLFSEGLIQKITALRGCNPPTHLLYADDNFIFCRADNNSLLNLMGFVECYSDHSGQLISKEKSHYFLGNIDVRKLVTISWDNVGLSKDARGLGIRDPIKLNQATNIKFCWDSSTASSIWGYYFRNQFLSGKDSRGRSLLRIALKACISLVQTNYRCLVGDGTNIHLRTDN